MYGVKLKTLTNEGTDPPEAFSAILLPQGSPGEQVVGSSTLTFKVAGGDHAFAEHLTPDLDLNVMEDMGVGFGDSLGDASMDCFTDLSSILMAPNFLGQQETNTEEEEEEEQQQVGGEALSLLNLEPAVLKPQQSLLLSTQHPFSADLALEEEKEDPPSDLAKLSMSVGLKRSRTPSLDHDYSAKRARLSPSPAASLRSFADTAVMASEDPFLVPEATSPAPSSDSDASAVAATVATSSESDKQKQRREKNNLASKRSREIRKQKFVNMAQEAEKLTEENARLERRVADLEKLALRMKEILVTKLKIQT